MVKLLRIFVTGIVISFIGALPLGSINLAAMQLAISDGLQAGLLFAAGMIIPDVFYVMITLLAMQWIQKQKRLFKILEWLTLAIVLALAAANFYAALQPVAQKNILLSNTLPPFLLGVVMNGINPMQIPFWLGWNTVLLTRKVLEPRWRHYYSYTAGVSIGLFAGTAIFIFGGRLIADRINSQQKILYLIVGGIFTLTALYQVWKMRKKKDVLHKLEHPEEIPATLEKTVDEWVHLSINEVTNKPDYMLNKAMIAEWKHEAASTRKMLERVPFEKWDWKPHDKSMTLGRLATHVATIPGWMTVTLTSDELDFAKGGYRPPVPTSKESLLEIFQSSYEKALQALEEANNELLREKWTLKNNGQVIFTRSKIGTLRSFVLNHLLHHRGQLSVYLRLLDVPVPGMYGPSADD